MIFSRANLEEALLINTEFAPSEYENLILFKADMRNAEIRDIDIRKVDLTGVKILEWQWEGFIDNLGLITLT